MLGVCLGTSAEQVIVYPQTSEAINDQISAQASNTSSPAW